jgi:elongation factor G
LAHRPEDVRNLALIGAGGAGKTSLLEALLALTKVISRRGSIPEKNTFSDHDPDERERGHSLFTTVAHTTWEGKRLQILDTPGSIDFLGEPAMALAAVETAVLCVNAHDGVTTAARKLARLALAQGLPLAVVLTRIEGENIDAEKVYAQLTELFGPRAVPINLPDRFGPGVKEVVDIFGPDVPADLKAQAAELRQQATDRIVECDESLLERYLAEGKVSLQELEAVYPRALRQGNIVPILHVSLERGVGLKKLLSFITHDCPKPSRVVLRKALDASGREVKLEPQGPFAAQVWKIVVDPHVGKVAWLRVWAGTLASKTQLVVHRTGTTERIGDLLEIQGKDLKAVASASAGDLVAVTKVEHLRIGDTVTAEPVAWAFAPIVTPVPKVTLAVMPKNRNDEAKLFPELHRIAEGDPTFVAERETGTGELVVRGLSPLHIDVHLKRLARVKKVESVTHAPRVPYLETIAAKGAGMYRHKKQSGGRGQFAEVHLKVEPLPRGQGFEFVDEVVGGTIPRQFIPAVEKGIEDLRPKGVFAGYPFVDVRAIVHFGKFHDVDSDEHSFKLAAAHAFKAAVAEARPALLEPLMDVEIEVPTRFLGDISGDLNSRRGRIVGMRQEGESSHIQAQVPLSEMMQYGTELRSLTAGEGDFTAKLAHYELVPAHLAQDIIAKHKQEPVPA